MDYIPAENNRQAEPGLAEFVAVRFNTEEKIRLRQI
jgi:hypothetical protein